MTFVTTQATLTNFMTRTLCFVAVFMAYVTVPCFMTRTEIIFVTMTCLTPYFTIAFVATWLTLNIVMTLSAMTVTLTLPLYTVTVTYDARLSRDLHRQGVGRASSDRPICVRLVLRCVRHISWARSGRGGGGFHFTEKKIYINLKANN